jgi:hypothetical protein
MAKWALVFIITAGGQPATVTFPGYLSQTACAQAGADAVDQSTLRSEDKDKKRLGSEDKDKKRLGLGYFCVQGPERTP